MDRSRHASAISHVGAAVTSGVIARFVCSGVLLVAAGLKAHRLLTDPAMGALYGSRWLESLHVEYEVLLAAWLLSGQFQRSCRLLAIVTFAAFASYAFYLGASGAESCGCFGHAHFSPWWTVVLDSAALFLLWQWKPTAGVELLPNVVEARISSPTVNALVNMPNGGGFFQNGRLQAIKRVNLELIRWAGFSLAAGAVIAYLALGIVICNVWLP